MRILVLVLICVGVTVPENYPPPSPTGMNGATQPKPQ